MKIILAQLYCANILILLYRTRARDRWFNSKLTSDYCCGGHSAREPRCRPRRNCRVFPASSNCQQLSL